MDKTKFLKTLLTTASAVAVMATGVQNAAAQAAAAGTGFSVPTADPAATALNPNNNNGTFKNGAGAAQAAAFTSNNNIINALPAGGAAGANDFTVNSNNVGIGSFDVYGTTTTITVFEDSSLGAVFNSAANAQHALDAKAQADGVHGGNGAAGAGAGAAAVANLTFGANKTVILDGKAAAAGGVSPTTFGAAINKYSSLGTIKFNAGIANAVAGDGAGGTLLANAAAAVNNDKTITLDVAKVDNTHIDKGHLQVDENLIVNHPSFVNVGKTTVADGKSITYNMGNNGATTSTSYDLGATSELNFNANLTANKDFVIGGNLRNGNGDANGAGAGNHTDGEAKISFNNAGNTLTIKSAAGAKTLGQDATHRLGSVSFGGAGDITVANTVNIFSKVIEKTGAGKLIVQSNIDQGAAQNPNAAAAEIHFDLKEGEAILAQLKTKGVNLGTAAAQNLPAAADVTLTVSGNGSALGDVTTAVDGKGKLIFADGGGASTVGDIGANGKALESVKVLGADTITIGGDAYADTFEFDDAQAVFEVGDGKTLHGDVKNSGAVAQAAAAQNPAPIATELKFLGAGEVTGTIGGGNAGEALRKVISGGAGTVKIGGDAYADTFEFGDAQAKFEVKAGLTLHGDVKNSGAVAQAAVAQNPAPIATELKFLGAGGVTGTIGGGNAGEQLAKVIAAGAGTVKIGGDAYADTFEFGDAQAKFEVKAGLTLHGDVKNSGAVAQAAVAQNPAPIATELKFLGAGGVTGTIGGNGPGEALRKVIAGGPGTVKIGDNARASKFELANAQAKFEVADQKTLTGDVVNTTGQDKKGQLVLIGQAEVTGNIGDPGAALELVQLGAGAGGGNKTLTLSKATGNHHANFKFANDAASKILVTGDNAKITGDIEANNGKGILSFTKNGEVVGKIGAGGAGKSLTKVKAADGTVKIGVDAYATGFDLNHANAKFEVANGVTLNGAVVNTANGEGVLEFLGDGKVTGQIGDADPGGAGAGVLARVKAGNGTVEIEDDAFATQFELGHANAKFEVANGKTMDGAVVNLRNGEGVLEFSKGGKVTGQIGAPAAAGGPGILAGVKAGDGIVEIEGDAYAGSFELDHVNSQFKVADKVTLNGDVVNTTTIDGKGKLILAGEAEVTGDIGASGAALELVQLGNAVVGNNKTLTLSKVGGDHHAHFQFADDVASKISVEGDGSKITGSIEGKNGKGILSFTKNGEIVGRIGANAANAVHSVALVTTEKELKLPGLVHTAGEFKLTSADASFVVGIGGTLKGDVVNVADGQGKLKFLGDAVVGKIGEDAGAAGGAGALDEVIFDGIGKVKIEGSAYAKQFTFNDENAELVVTDASGLNGMIRNTVAGKSAGKILFEGVSKVANIGENGKALKEVTSNAKEVSISGKSYADRFNLGKNGSFKVADGAELHGDIFNTDGATNGSLTMEGSAKINGNIGEDGKALTLVKLADAAGTLDLLKANSTHYTNFQFGNDAASELKVADGVAIHGNIIGNTAPVVAPPAGGGGAPAAPAVSTGQLIFAGNGTVDGLIGVDAAGTAAAEVPLVQVKGTLSLDKAGTHNVTKFTLVDAGSEIKAADGVILNAQVQTNSPGKGKLAFAGNNEVGAIGTNVAALESVTASGKVTLNETSYAASFGLDADDAEFIVENNQDLHGAVKNLVNGSSAGKLTFEGTGIAYNAVGENGKVLLSLTSKANEVELKETVYSESINLGNGGSFKVADGKDLHGNIKNIAVNPATNVPVNNRGELVLEGSTTINGDIGEDGKALKLVTLSDADGKALTLSKENSVHYTNFKFGTSADSQINVGKSVTINGNILAYAAVAPAGAAAAVPYVAKGNLVFSDGGKIGGTIGVSDEAGAIAAPIKSVSIAGKVELLRDSVTHNAESFMIIGNSELSVANNVVLNGTVTTNTAGQGKLTFTGSGAVNSTIGAAGKALEFVASSGAGTVKLCADSYAGSFNLGDEKSIFDVADSVKLTGNVVNVTDADNQGTLNFLKTGTLDGNIGSAEKPLELVIAATDNVNLSKENSVHYSKNFKVGAAGSKFTLGKGASYNGNFIVSNTGVGELSFNGTGAKIVGNVGGAGSIFKLVNFAENGSISGDLYANSVEIADGKRADFGKLVSVTSGIKLLGDTSIAGFDDGAVYDSIIDPSGSTKGVLRFAGASTINKQIKDVSNVMFGADSVDVKVIDRGTINQLKFTNLNVDVTSPTISSGHSVLYATNSAKLGDSAATSTATVQYFGAAAGKTLSFVNKGDAGSKLSLSGNAAVVLNKIVLNGKVDPGKVAMSSGKLDITGMTSLSVVIDDTGAPKVAENDTESYNFLTLPAGTDLSAVNIAVNNLKDGLSLEKWTASIDGTTVGITRSDNTEEAVKDLVVESSGNSEDVANLVTAIRGSEGINEIVRNIKNSDKIVELGQRLKVSDPKEIVSNVTTKVATQNAIRLNALNSSQFVGPDLKTASADQKGVAAGDYGNARHGVWVSPFYGSSSQKARNSAAGYKSSTFGGSFGVDTKPNDHSIIGMSLAALNTDVKYKDFKVGDKNKIDSLMFSVYGMHQITDNWFAQAIATVGSSTTKTNERRLISDSQYQTAKAKYTSMSFNGELLFGYNYLADEFLITPKAGMRFSRVNDAGYKESGTTNQNLSVSRKALNRAEIVVGGTASHRGFDVNGMSITPEVHAFFNQEMIGKKSDIDIRLEGGSKIDAGSSKPVKSTYNVGTGVSFMYNSMEYGVSYDAIIASKFTGHQGTLKVRVNF